MEAMPQSWNDDRLDDLNVKVDRGFEHVDRRFEQVDERFEQIDRRFEQVDRRFDQIDRRFEKIDERFEKNQEEFIAVRREMKEGFDGLHRLLIRVFAGFAAAFLAGVFGVVATQL
ncbi:MAG: hypothetical protein ABW065_01110 [Solirubrobacterales bacterium]